MQATHKVSIVLLAGGKGLRIGNDTPKQLLNIHNKPLWYYATNTFHKVFKNAKWILVFPKEYINTIKTEFATFFPTISSNDVHIISGGKERFNSVQHALPFCEDNSLVFVHDIARCCLREQLIKNLYTLALEKNIAIPYTPPKDSIRLRKSPNSNHSTFLNRDNVMCVQTPQVFQNEILQASYTQQSFQEGFTDDASVVEAAQYKLHWLKGDADNIKVTFASDIKIASCLLADSF